MISAKSISVAIFTFGMFIFSSCTKESISPDYKVIKINTEAEIHNIFFNDSLSGYAVGGIKNESGYIFKTDDGGALWKEIFHSDTNLNDIYFLTSEYGFACGDDILLLRTLDSGNNWEKVTYGWNPPEAYITPLKRIEFADDKNGYLTGGAFFSKGLVFRTENGGFWWEPEHFDNEMSASYFSEKKTGLFGGYGLITKTTDGAKTFQPVDIKGDFYTSFCFLTKETGFACGYNGGIYKTTDGGDNWKTVFQPNNLNLNRIHLNDITFTNTEKGIAVGNEGVILISNDSGDTWEKADKFTNNKLFSVTKRFDDYVWITSENGNIYQLNL